MKVAARVRRAALAWRRMTTSFSECVIFFFLLHCIIYFFGEFFFELFFFVWLSFIYFFALLLQQNYEHDPKSCQLVSISETRLFFFFFFGAVVLLLRTINNNKTTINFILIYIKTISCLAFSNQKPIKNGLVCLMHWAFLRCSFW